ncbi:hypothetical protein OUZ56_010523 [Daphnia magna]|uniref:Uncharacterized protein n=1 Tax=Daphnia magna TaxID=35525 RepID=A0ABR0AIR1_9CRUS|nr:hypothetical protein OUZ56_010523 [Daphnia magna]
MANLSRYRELDDSILNWLNAIRNLTSRCKPFSLSRAHIQAQASNEAMAREIWDFKESGWVATGDSVARSGLVFFFLERLEMLTSQKRNLSLRRFLTNWSATEYGMSCTTWTKLACLIVLDLHLEVQKILAAFVINHLQSHTYGKETPGSIVMYKKKSTRQGRIVEVYNLFCLCFKLPVHDFIVTNGVCVAVLTVMLESPASNVSRI